MGYMIWFYITWNFGIEDMILYPISEKKSYHIYIFFSLEIWSMSREKVCDPGEFIASFKPKKVWHSCLVCLGKIKNVRCWSGAVNYIKLLTTTVSNQKNNTTFATITWLTISRRVTNELWLWYFEDISQDCRYEERYFLGTIDMDKLRKTP